MTWGRISRAGALPRENAVVVAVKRNRLLSGLISLRRCLGSELAEWAWHLAFGRRPIEAILFPWTTYNPLRIDPAAQSGRIERRIFVLRLHISEGDLHRRELVAANATAQNFIKPFFGVELPFAGVVD